MQDYDLRFRYIVNDKDVFEIRKYKNKKEFDFYHNDNFFRTFDSQNLNDCKNHAFRLMFFILKAEKKKIDEEIERILMFVTEGYI